MFELKNIDLNKIYILFYTTFYIMHHFFHGCAIAQAVSRWLPTTVAWVCVRAACGVCGGQSGSFFQVLQLPLPIIPPISPSS
jgi:hypothetical protein